MLIPGISDSQSKSEKVKVRLTELFALAKAEKFSDAASYLVYRGKDESRRWKDVYIYSNENEDKEVTRVCKEIKGMLTGGSYEFAKFKTETESEGEWCIWEVNFSTGEQKKVYFACLLINGVYCLGDID
jgi:hypothetical protein